ncbi:hypothetical protein B5F74_11915, partial [Collinsella sp. An271]|uniref:helix-turn-helix domain-containing protein n=1 Tax=Collinsella sp. An271 TaxID=1965616 RepID=UPI000B56433D
MYPKETRELALEALRLGFSVREAAELAGCSRRSVRTWRAKGAGCVSSSLAFGKEHTFLSGLRTQLFRVSSRARPQTPDL